MSKIEIPIPPEVEPYADDIRRFVHAMVYKLKVHHRKGRWEGKSVGEYLPLLDGEVTELRDAVNGGNLIEVLTEAADCANMALIISAIATERGIDGQVEESDRGDTAGNSGDTEQGGVGGGVQAGGSNRSEFAPPVSPKGAT